jgi:hypothetical protein
MVHVIFDPITHEFTAENHDETFVLNGPIDSNRRMEFSFELL